LQYSNIPSAQSNCESWCICDNFFKKEAGQSNLFMNWTAHCAVCLLLPGTSKNNTCHVVCLLSLYYFMELRLTFNWDAHNSAKKIPFTVTL